MGTSSLLWPTMVIMWMFLVTCSCSALKNETHRQGRDSWSVSPNYSYTMVSYPKPANSDPHRGYSTDQGSSSQYGHNVYVKYFRPSSQPSVSSLVSSTWGSDKNFHVSPSSPELFTSTGQDSYPNAYQYRVPAVPSVPVVQTSYPVYPIQTSQPQYQGLQLIYSVPAGQFQGSLPVASLPPASLQAASLPSISFSSSLPATPLSPTMTSLPATSVPAASLPANYFTTPRPQVLGPNLPAASEYYISQPSVEHFVYQPRPEVNIPMVHTAQNYSSVQPPKNDVTPAEGNPVKRRFVRPGAQVVLNNPDEKDDNPTTPATNIGLNPLQNSRYNRLKPKIRRRTTQRPIEEVTTTVPPTEKTTPAPRDSSTPKPLQMHVTNNWPNGNDQQVRYPWVFSTENLPVESLFKPVHDTQVVYGSEEPEPYMELAVGSSFNNNGGSATNRRFLRQQSEPILDDIDAPAVQNSKQIVVRDEQYESEEVMPAENRYILPHTVQNVQNVTPHANEIDRKSYREKESSVEYENLKPQEAHVSSITQNIARKSKPAENVTVPSEYKPRGTTETARNNEIQENVVKHNISKVVTVVKSTDNQPHVSVLSRKESQLSLIELIRQENPNAFPKAVPAFPQPMTTGYSSVIRSMPVYRKTPYK